MSRKIVFTGGGTGGHVTPAIAISESVREMYDSVQFRYVGKKGKAEEGIVPKEWSGYGPSEQNVVFVSTTSGSAKSPRVLMTLAFGCIQAAAFLLRFKPDAIVATGGYVSAPIVFAAGIMNKIGLLRSKIVLHEANAELGRMNKMAIRFADKVAVSFPGTKGVGKKKMYVGYPVRKRLVVEEGGDQNESRRIAREKLGIPQDAKVVFAFGGSQGARTINRGIVDAIPLLLKDPKVIVLHGTGKKLQGASYYGKADVEKRLQAIDVSELETGWKDRYRYTDFIHNMGDYYAATDLVICRCGAGSLVEVCANGIASISIPKANLPGDHQAVNACVLEKLNATKVVYERVDVASGDSVESVDPSELSTLTFQLLNDPDLRMRMGVAARTQYDSTTSSQCAAIIGGLLGDCGMPITKEEPILERDRILGKNTAALRFLLANVHRKKETLTDQERRLALYKIDAWIGSSSYVEAARACHMFGLGKYTERIDVLLYVATNPKQYPIVRRDACKGLRSMGVLNAQICETLLKATKDNYFETRVEALHALYVLFANNPRKGIDVKKVFSVATGLARAKDFDVRMYALALLALLCDNFSDIEKIYQANYFHPNWQVREMMVKSFVRLQKDNKIDDDKVRDILENRFLQTSYGFDIQFKLKEELIQLYTRKERERFVKEVQDVIYSDDEQSNKSQRLIDLSKKAKEKNLDINIQALFNVDENEKELKEVITAFEDRLAIAFKKKDKDALVSLQEEIQAHPLSEQLDEYLDAIDVFLKLPSLLE